MTSKRLLFPLLLTIGLCLLIAVPVFAETEPNDSLMAPEIVGEGTIIGTVSMNGTEFTDKDYYQITVPSKKDIEITVRKTDTGYGTVSVYSYDNNKELMGIFGGIWIVITTGGVRESDSWYNGGDSDANIFLEVEGDGDYEIDIEFTDDTATLGKSCLIITLVFFGIFVLIIAVIIVIIIFVKKKQKENMPPPPPPDYYKPQAPAQPPQGAYQQQVVQQTQYPPQRPPQ